MNSSSDFTDDKLCELASGGNAEAEEILVSRYSRLVRACARPLFLVGGDSEDLIQEGMLGLLSAIRDYDSEKEASFSTYAELCIKRRLYSAIRSASRDKHAPLNNSVSLDASLFDESIPKAELFSQNTDRQTEEQVLGKERANELFDDLVGYLSRFEARILGFYLSGLSYREIAEQLNISPKSVDNAVQRIRQKLARRM